MYFKKKVTKIFFYFCQHFGVTHFLQMCQVHGLNWKKLIRHTCISENNLICPLLIKAFYFWPTLSTNLVDTKINLIDPLERQNLIFLKKNDISRLINFKQEPPPNLIFLLLSFYSKSFLSTVLSKKDLTFYI